MRIEKLKGSRFLLTGMVLMALILAGCSMPGSGTGSEMQAGDQEAARVIGSGSVSRVACGHFFSMALKSDGTLWVTGDNEFGQLGLGHNSNVPAFTKVMSGVKDVACGDYHCLVLKTDGSLWAAGRNDHGQLGTGNTNNSNIFVRSKDQNGGNMTSIGKIACGGFHSLAVRTSGSLYATGWNLYGALALGDTTERHGFEKAKDENGNYMTVKAIEAGQDYSMAVKTDGTLWSAGANFFGNLGVGDYSHRYLFVRSKNNAGNYMTSISKIECGGFHALALKTDGTLWAVGNNQYGQLGNGEHGDDDDDCAEQITFIQVMSSVSGMAAGYMHSLAVRTTGSLYATGFGYWGELGTGDNLDRCTFTKARDQNGNYMTVKASAGAGVSSMAVKTNGTLWATGRNERGQLGTGDGQDRYLFTSVP